MTPPMPDIFTLLDEVQTLARNGLHYATNSDDRERYARLLTLVAQSYAALLGVPEATILAREAHELGQITPKVGADAAILNPDGEILLMDWRCAIGPLTPSSAGTRHTSTMPGRSTGCSVPTHFCLPSRIERLHLTHDADAVQCR
jgi:hypothetical protein